MNKKVACGSFVKRQTEDSGYSHYDGDWDQLEELVAKAMRDDNNIIPGYRDGVVLVRIPDAAAPGFYSGTVRLDNKTRLVINYAPRRAGEAPFLRISAKAEKQSAKAVEIVCYRADVLAENNERETDADWEIVAIKARPSFEEEPMHYYTMARNHLGLEGGTKGSFSAEEFAQSIVYWNSHCMCQGQRNLFGKIAKWIRSTLHR